MSTNKIKRTSRRVRRAQRRLESAKAIYEIAKRVDKGGKGKGFTEPGSKKHW